MQEPNDSDLNNYKAVLKEFENMIASYKLKKIDTKKTETKTALLSSVFKNVSNNLKPDPNQSTEAQSQRKSSRPS